MAFDPSTVPGYWAHYKADSLTEVDGAALASWPDASPSALHLAQADVVRRPVVRENALNGLRVVDFTPSQDLTSAAFADNPQPNTVILLAKTDALGSSRIAFDGIASNRRWAVYLQGSTNEWRGYAGAVVNSTVVMEADRWYRVAVVFEGATSDIWVDDAPPVRGNASTHPVSAVRVGAHWDGKLGWDGQIAEVIVYDGRVSDADIAALNNYLLAKWFTAPDQPAQVAMEGGSARSAAVAAAAGRSGLVESGTGRQPSIEA